MALCSLRDLCSVFSLLTSFVLNLLLSPVNSFLIIYTVVNMYVIETATSVAPDRLIFNAAFASVENHP